MASSGIPASAASRIWARLSLRAACRPPRSRASRSERSASHHTPELFHQWSEFEFARKEYEASKRRKGGGVTPDDMAQIFDIQEYRLEECFGLNRRKRGGLVSVERPKHVREAERKTDWFRARDAE